MPFRPITAAFFTPLIIFNTAEQKTIINFYLFTPRKDKTKRKIINIKKKYQYCNSKLLNH